MTLAERIDKLSTDEAAAVAWILHELDKAKGKHRFVDDPVHAAGVLCEEAGETMKAALDLTYAHGLLTDMGFEAAQTGAVAIRILTNIERMQEHKHLEAKW